MNLLMLNDLFKEQLQFNAELVGELSRFNCHVRGLHSIVVGRQRGGQLLRIYVAEPGSALHNGLNDANGGLSLTNEEGRLGNGFVPRPSYELGLHPHHCDLNLKMLRGKLLHWTFVPVRRSLAYQYPASTITELFGHKYHSKLRGEAPGFTREGSHWFRLDDYRVLDAEWLHKRGINLPADALHTVHVPHGETYVAWLVAEGAEDPAYEPMTYSNRPLDRYDFSDLYQPMRYPEAVRLLADAGILR